MLKTDVIEHFGGVSKPRVFWEFPILQCADGVM